MTPEAIQEVKDKMLPMRHLNDVRKGYGASMFAPGHEAILGSVFLSKKDETVPTVTFHSEHEALEALKSGKISASTEVVISGHGKKAELSPVVDVNHAEGDPKTFPVKVQKGQGEDSWVEQFLPRTEFTSMIGDFTSNPETGTGTSLRSSV
jgi:hypothetical protein